jgi:hypothetical protein
MRFLIGLIGLVLMVQCVACHDGCKKEETKCDGTKVMICNASEDWELVMDCGEIEPVEMDWTCCYMDVIDEYACLPVEECGGIVFDGGGDW